MAVSRRSLPSPLTSIRLLCSAHKSSSRASSARLNHTCPKPPHDLITVASLTVSEVVTAAGSYIGHCDEYLPSALRNFLAQAATSIQQTAHHLPQPILDNLNSLQAKTPANFLYPTLLLTFIFLLSMSGWTRRFWPSGGRSPFGAAVGATPTVTDDDFSYMGPGDIVDPPLRSRGTMSHNEAYGFPPRNTTRADSESLSPDILTIKHKGVTYPLLFPAFTISDGALKISDLRRLAAEKTRADDTRRVKLLYKGRVLKDDLRACRDEGLKQNSELMCVVSEAAAVGNGYPGGAGDDSSSSADEDEILAAEGLSGPRVDVDGSIIDDGRPRRRKGHRGGKKKKSGSGLNSPRESTHHLSPGGAGPGPGPSTSRSSSPKPPPPSQPPSQQQQQRPKMAMEKLDELASMFRTQFVPKCVQFTLHPPSDGRAKDLEYKKLSESILAQIILKLDAVETEGDEAARAKRKALVKETQDVLNELDRVGKRGA